MAPREFKYETYRKCTDIIKARFTRLEDIVTKVTTGDQPVTPVQVRQLNTIFAELKKKRADFESNLNRIMEFDSEEATESVLSDDVDSINDLYIRISAMIEVSISPDPLSPASVHDNTSERQFPTSVIAGVKLPKLNLQPFDGTPLQWISFINLFDTAVHKNTTISNVAKFQYLLSVLSGEPLNLIKSLNLTAPNYLIAYQLLRDRYHNIRRLTTLHLNYLLDIPPISHNNPKQLRSFITTFYEHTESLKAIDCEITQNNPLLSAHILRKLDNTIVQRLEQYRETKRQPDDVSHSLPKVEEIIQFLNTECSHIEDASLHSTTKQASTSIRTPEYSKRLNLTQRNAVSLSTVVDKHTPSTSISCFCCGQQGHKIYQCASFKNKTPNERYKLVKDHHRCVSCLGTHQVTNCQSKRSCGTCHKKHHSLLHFNEKTQEPSSRFNAPLTPSHTADATLSCASQNNVETQNSTVLLSTALVKLTAINGHSYVFRALLDSGSMVDFVSERAAQLLGGKRHFSNLTVSGLAQTYAHTKGALNFNVDSLSGQSVASQHSFHVLEKISVDLPRVEISPEVLLKTQAFVLADPTFNKPGPIDVLIGSALFPQLLTNERHSLGPNMPHALGTVFGYVIVGLTPCSPLVPRSSNIAVSLLSTMDIDLHTSIQRFWTQEEIPPCNKKTTEEIACDQLFEATHTRDRYGRYVVRLPFSHSPAQLGASKTITEQRFHALERRIHHTHNLTLRASYSEFMSEYYSLGHMEKCTHIDLTAPHYFLPHHGVLKAHGNASKLRVVFDASSKTSSGLSLNDILLTGPKLQNNICDIILQFRLENVVFSCDIRQMYRQIRIHPDDQNFQLVLWRETPTLPMSIFKLTTVTYGMNCSPYLAIKTLHQLAEDEGKRFPRAAEILKHQSYVDDLLAGASSEEEALDIQHELIDLLKLGGFELRKWVSNSPKLLQNLPIEHQESPVFLQPSSEPHFSILGLHWSPITDTFRFGFDFTCDTPTKRKVLSLIAQIYDPCGFLSPCIMTAKRFMQLLWTSGNTWDEPLDAELTLKWHNFITDMKHIVHIAIPRAIKRSQIDKCDLHGFSDASETGYAAVVYLLCVSENNVHITQIIAKTRAAPLKRVTLPRLELCAAHLLAQLVKYVQTQYNNALKMDSIHLWCDSTVTLSWLQTPPYRLKTYVANRVAQVQELIPSHCWHHISSIDNPADCASRGIMPSQLVNHQLWWHGPPWLRHPPAEWPKSDFSYLDTSMLDEVKVTPLTVLVSAPQPICELLFRFSSWTRLLHVLAYVLRFILHSRRQETPVGPLDISELQAARLRIFRLVQQEAFSEDIAALQNKRTCSSRLQRLAPFLDQDNLLRVGGRLKHANVTDDVRHPYILPKKHHVVDLLVDHTHKQHLHSGTQLTVALLSQQVWILSARSVVRSRIFKCMTCFKNRPRNTFPLMGDLPQARVTPARPFLSTGIDYGGPFDIKIHNLRSIRHIKAYLCIFVCFVTKAVHLETTTDLSTDSFIGALTRFVSRRGLCSHIYSDCGTMFVGAKNALQQIIESKGKEQINNFATEHNIKFHFNPPAAPHQGGLWESAIKGAKYHLKRALGIHVPTLVEFNTVTCRVEAMLNSRPLTALSNDPSDLQALTPGHFLVGTSLAALPEHNLVDIPENRLSHWQLMQAIMQRLWKRWKTEYLHTLQQRLKWNVPTKNLEVGDLVLLHQDSPSLVWPLGRITKVTSGSDNVVRVVEVRTQHGTYSRPAVKVSLLPFLASKD